ncbi:hypothetical protein [Spongiactinospora sp. TRM90649]|uniref:hypothetical protein n=1 Tax=Spongiactinospora sp. TRM90649 TaxID=3031114 RepID=UPI0023F874DC|nr:hypothetical protein [Spongiactinospora sp. TRM90649]MDF5758768.1 hypothetical protein [Spongiactinospora sp. TRM90649]
MTREQEEAFAARSREEEAIYRFEAALGQDGADAAITTMVADIRAAVRDRERLREQGASAYAVQSATRYIHGLIIGLGRLLALRDGMGAEKPSAAWVRGCQHLRDLGVDQ